MKEYEDLIDYEILNDLMEINNLKIEIYSQLSDCENFRRQIIEGYSLLRSRAKENKRYSIDVSTLRMMHNAHMNIDAVLDVINKNIKDYYFLDMPEKYIAFKEIINMIKVDLNIADECLKTNRFGTMRKHVNSAEYCMKNISGHPAAVEFNLRLAFYNYILKNMEKAKV